MDSNLRSPEVDIDAERSKPGLTDDATCRSGRFVGRPFCELGPAVRDPAVRDIVLGVFGRHFDGAIQADIDVSAREGLHGADAGRRQVEAR